MAKEKKLAKEEMIKQSLHPLQVWERIKIYSQDNTIPSPDDRFRMRWYGLFYEGEEKNTCMSRVKIPGGYINAQQLKGLAGLIEKYGIKFADISTRQGMQIRSFKMNDLPDYMESLEGLGLSSVASGADNIRNIISCAFSGIYRDEITDTHELMDELRRDFGATQEFYDLPRKFNISFCGCGTNCTHPDIHDIGVVAVRKDRDVYYALSIGGAPSSANPVFSSQLGIALTREEVVPVCHAIVDIFRLHGYRDDRRKARFKVLVSEKGVNWVREEVEKRLNKKFPAYHYDTANTHGHDTIGVFPQKQKGLYAIGTYLSAGRLTTGDMKIISDISEKYADGQLRTTNQQNIMIINIPETNLSIIKQELTKSGLRWEVPDLYKGFISCTGAEFCKLAAGETKQRGLMILDKLSRKDTDARIALHVSGCINSCGNHTFADIGLITNKMTDNDGVKLDAFNIHIGGGLEGEHIWSRKIFSRVIDEKAALIIKKAIRVYKKHHKQGESFKDFCSKYSDEELEILLTPQVNPGGRFMQIIATGVMRLGGDKLTNFLEYN